MASTTHPAVRAAGTLPWRIRGGALEVALVHRVKYDDWSWPKGKLDRGEDWAAAAARETFEETGMQVRLGLPLPTAHYRVNGGAKEVRYWAARRVGGHGRLEHEIDRVRWLRPVKARALLTYRRDRAQLDALVAAHERGELDVWPLLLIRHAKAIGRGSWSEEDPIRPLDGTGRRRAVRIVPLLASYVPADLVSSPSLRCYDTLVPYAVGTASGIRARTGFSEEGYEADPSAAVRHLAEVVSGGAPTALCTHGPLFADLLTSLAPHLPPQSGRLARTLRTLVKKNLDKGEVLVATMSGTGARARILDLERHRPPRG